MSVIRRLKRATKTRPIAKRRAPAVLHLGPGHVYFQRFSAAGYPTHPVLLASVRGMRVKYRRRRPGKPWTVSLEPEAVMGVITEEFADVVDFLDRHLHIPSVPLHD